MSRVPRGTRQTEIDNGWGQSALRWWKGAPNTVVLAEKRNAPHVLVHIYFSVGTLYNSFSIRDDEEGPLLSVHSFNVTDNARSNRIPAPDRH